MSPRVILTKENNTARLKTLSVGSKTARSAAPSIWDTQQTTFEGKRSPRLKSINCLVLWRNMGDDSIEQVNAMQSEQ